MKTLNFPASACRYCRHYCVQGRRGGMCQQLGVPVRGSWKACSLALPPFAPSWESIDELLQDNQIILKEPVSVNCSLGCCEPNLSKVKASNPDEKLKSDIVLV